MSQTPTHHRSQTPTGQAVPGTDGGPQQRDPRSTAQLVNDLAELLPRLVREELALATAELREKGRHAGLGAGLLGGGVLALYGGGALVAAAVLGLAHAVPAWLAALIVGVVLLAGAGGFALVAKQQVSEAVPPTPERAVAGVREDVATVKDAATKERSPR